MDVPLLRWINGWPASWEPFFRFWSEATQMREVRILLLLIVLGMLLRGARSRFAILSGLIAFPIANELCDVMKYAFKAPRPFQVLEGIALRAGESDSFGTASAHSANMAAVATAMTMILGPRWGAIWIAAAFFTGLSRSYVGVHFPLQVLFGWSLGIFAGWVTVQTGRRLLKRIGKPIPNVGVEDEPETPEAA